MNVSRACCRELLAKASGPAALPSSVASHAPEPSEHGPVWIATTPIDVSSYANLSTRPRWPAAPRPSSQQTQRYYSSPPLISHIRYACRKCTGFGLMTRSASVTAAGGASSISRTLRSCTSLRCARTLSSDPRAIMAQTGFMKRPRRAPVRARRVNRERVRGGRGRKRTEDELDDLGSPGVRHIAATPDGCTAGEHQSDEQQKLIRAEMRRTSDDCDRDGPEDEEVQRRENRACGAESRQYSVESGYCQRANEAHLSKRSRTA